MVEIGFKFEKLKIWQSSLDFVDVIYDLANELPANEAFNLNSQMRRAVTSINLNIAEGSTGQTDDEQARFLGLALRSTLEVVACLHIVKRRRLIANLNALRKPYEDAYHLVNGIAALRKTIAPNQKWLREEIIEYGIDSGFLHDLNDPSSVSSSSV